MPFVYSTPPNRYALSIGDYLEHAGDIAAQRAIAVAQAQAQGALGAGQAWGQAIQHVGQDVAGALTTMTDPRRQAEAMALTEAKREQAGRALIAKGLQGGTPIGPQEPGAPPPATQHPYLDEQTGLVDPEKVSALLNANGMGDLAPTLLQSISAQNDSITQFKEHQQAAGQKQAIMLGAVANTTLKLMQSGMSLPDAARHASASLVATGAVPPAQIDQTIAQLSALTPDQAVAQLQQMKTTAATLGPTKTIGKDAVEVNMFNEPVVSNRVPEKPTKETLAVAAAAGDPSAQAALDKLNAQTPAQLETARHNQAMEEAAQKRLDQQLKEYQLNKSEGINADDPNAQKAIDVFGTFLAQTGRMPIGVRIYGKNSAQFYTAIGANAAEKVKAAGSDMATNAAAFTANEASLRQQQKFADAAQAFLNTADQNAALLKDTLKTLPDVGSPIFNQPLRSFAQKVAGDPNMSRFATYLTSVQNEYAKIITNPNLSGQLTDAARRDVEQLVQPNATVRQIVASVDALKTEGGNRLKSIQTQIGTIRGRVGSMNQAGAPSLASAVPDLTGLQPGHGRTFSSGPFAGQTWTTGPDGQPRRVR